MLHTDSKKVRILGERYTWRSWAKRTGISEFTLRARHKKGYRGKDLINDAVYNRIMFRPDVPAGIGSGDHRKVFLDTGSTFTNEEGNQGEIL